MNNPTTLCIFPIKNGVSKDFVKNTFERKYLAKINDIVLDQICDDYSVAHLEVHFWYNSFEVKDFLHKLNHPNKEARIIYNTNDWWIVR